MSRAEHSLLSKSMEKVQMPLKNMMWTSLVSSVVMLSGCGNNYNGAYRAMEGIIGPLIVLSINDSEAIVTRIDPFRKLILSEDTLSAKEKDGKLLITNIKGKTLIFARALDEKNLECLNCGLGSGFPGTWQFFAMPE
jgi:hypothetical protein